MESRYLVTTADERTWPQDTPIVFLGEWCRSYGRKSFWQTLDAKVLPYHWDDREKFRRDYLWLQELYEKMLGELHEDLNAIHGVNYSLRFWRILIGPWLGYFSQMTFDRWTMIEKACRSYQITGVSILETSAERLVPFDMGHLDKLLFHDPWNEAVYGYLLRHFTEVPVSTVPVDRSDLDAVWETAKPVAQASFVARCRRALSRALLFGSEMLSRDNDAFFLSTYLPVKQDLLLQWQLKQVPKLWRSSIPPRTAVNAQMRQWQMPKTGETRFSDILRKMVPDHMPTLYLEGFDALQEHCANLPWPKKPSLMFTSSAYCIDDVFKSWAAKKTEEGAPLVVGQHGGTYGVSECNFFEDHEREISDLWISWGWEAKNDNKIKPISNLRLIGAKLGWDPQGGILLVQMTMPRYSYHLFSSLLASQWLDYFADQSRFIAALPQSLHGQVLARLSANDYGWCQKQRWKDCFPQIRVDDGTVPIHSLIEKSRICISTYNSTTFLETLSLNVPTLMYWNERYWEVRESAVPYFNRLKEVGIFHSTPESAAVKLAEIGQDVESWWNQPEIQEARLYFCNGFTRVSSDSLRVLKDTLSGLFIG